MNLPVPIGRAVVGLTTAVAVLATACAASPSPTRTSWFAWRKEYRRPSQIPYPKDDPYSKAKYTLGRMLFFDPILSGSRSRSCASCHNPGLSWADGRPRAIGETQQPLPLRTPTLLNVAWIPRLGWDGHFRDLESVAMGPITSPGNMDLSEQGMIERLSAIPGYVHTFRTAFGTADVTTARLEKALATFERSIVSEPAPFDHWINGSQAAISAAAKRGFTLFNGTAHCAACHSGWAFTDASFHDIGTAQGDDIGRGKLFPKSVALQYAFKTPTLRDVVHRAPYMHNGSVTTLEAVIDLYDRGGIERPSRDPEIRPLNLSADEKADLIAFLRTLDSPLKSVAIPALPR